MNERFPVQSTQKTNFQEGHTMPKQFPTEDFARVIHIVGKEFPAARVLPERLTTMVEYTRKNLAKEGTDKNPSKKALEKAITAALKSHKGLILTNRKKMYRLAVELFLKAEHQSATKIEKKARIPRYLELDMLKTQKERHDDPND